MTELIVVINVYYFLVKISFRNGSGLKLWAEIDQISSDFFNARLVNEMS